MKKVDKDVEDKLEKKLLLNPTLEDIIKFLDGKIETIIRRTTDNMLVEDFTKTKENIGEKINWKKEKKKNVQHQLDSELFYLMSKGKRFILSCPELLVIMFNPETEQYEEAEYDPKYGNCNYDRGQPKPQPEKPINDKLFKPASQLQIGYFCRCANSNENIKSNLQKFKFILSLNQIVTSNKPDALELSEHSGDSCHRYFSYRILKYK